jgi:hypothetical protein
MAHHGTAHLMVGWYCSGHSSWKDNVTAAQPPRKPAVPPLPPLTRQNTARPAGEGRGPGRAGQGGGPRRDQRVGGLLAAKRRRAADGEAGRSKKAQPRSKHG